jgi:hypothetical protein
MSQRRPPYACSLLVIGGILLQGCDRSESPDNAPSRAEERLDSQTRAAESQSQSPIQVRFPLSEPGQLPFELLRKSIPELPRARAAQRDPELIPAKHVETEPAAAEHEPNRVRETTANCTAHGHAADWSWLTGELHYAYVRDAWRIRFARGEDERRFGGSLTLRFAELPSTLHDGQKVRLEGRLDRHPSWDPNPMYIVTRLEILP